MLNDGHGGKEGEEGVAVLAALQDDGVPLAHPVAGPQQGQGAADHDGGVQPGGHDDVGAHGGGGGLAVGAGDAQGVLVAPHDGAPGLGPLKDGDAGGVGGGDLRIVVVDGGGADDQLGLAQVLGPVADVDGDAQAPQVLHRGALPHVGAGDDHAGSVEHFGKGRHGDPADTRQVGPASGGDEGANIQISHGFTHPFW